MFSNYQLTGYKLAQYYLHDYFKLISIVSNKIGKDILFIKKNSQVLFII